MRAGNFKNAYEIYQRLLLETLPDGEAHTDLDKAVQCLNRLGRISDFDELAEAAIKRHASDWKLLRKASNLYSSTTHYGYIVSGEFKRGPHRGTTNAKYATSTERDRVRAIQLLRQAIEISGKADAVNRQRAELFEDLSRVLFQSRSGAQLVAMTDVATLPDYEQGQRYWRGFGTSAQGAPVNEDGTPFIHSTPRTWDEAKTDGERWRWAMMEAAELNPELAASHDL